MLASLPTVKDRPYTAYHLHRPMSHEEIAAALGLDNQKTPIWMPREVFYVEIDGPSPEGCEVIAELADAETLLVVSSKPYANYHAKVCGFAEPIPHGLPAL